MGGGPRGVVDGGGDDGGVIADLDVVAIVSDELSAEVAVDKAVSVAGVCPDLESQEAEPAAEVVAGKGLSASACRGKSDRTESSRDCVGCESESWTGELDAVGLEIQNGAERRSGRRTWC